MPTAGVVQRLSGSALRLDAICKWWIEMAMRKTTRILLITSLLVSLGSGCQLINRGTEVRMEEQMLKIIF
jgi:hypothetical protein